MVRTTVKMCEISDVFVLFNEAYGYFVEVKEGFASYPAQIELVEICAEYIVNRDEERFLEETEMIFDFEKKDIKKIIKNYKKELKEV